MDPAIRLTRSFLCAAALAAAAVAPSAAQQSAPASSADRSTRDGAYTATQATRGESVFRNVCGNCHPTSEFSGPGFQAKWSGGTLFSLVDQIRSNMPLDNPGGLSAEEYAAVVAYILKLNSFPAGSAELPTDDAALRRIRFEAAPKQQP